MNESTFSEAPANSPLFEVVLSGEILGQIPLLQVQKNLAQLFRMPEQKLAALLAAGNVTLKKGLEFNAAQRYKAAIENAGAGVVVRAINVALPAVAPAPQATPLEARETLSAAGEDLMVPRRSEWTLTAAGQNLLRPDERAPQISRLNDYVNFELRQIGNNLLDEDELLPLPIIELAVTDFGLAPAGADVLMPSERQAPVPASAKPGAWSLAPVGERLSELETVAAMAPSVAHLSLEEPQK